MGSKRSNAQLDCVFIHSHLFPLKSKKKKNPENTMSRGKQNVHIYFKTEIYNFNWLNELKYDKSITNKII